MSEKPEILFRLKKNWSEYDQKSLLLWFLKNSEKMDCSFVIKCSEEGDELKEKKIVSCRWILMDISPYFRKIFNSKEFHDTNYDSIPIDDPNFMQILSYAHTKILHKQKFKDLLNLYESARNFQIEPLMNRIICMLHVAIQTDVQCGTIWIEFFKLAYSCKEVDLRLFYVFEKIMQTIPIASLEQFLNINMETVMSFDEDLFYDFLTFLKAHKIRPILCFKIAEKYIEEKINVKTQNIFEDIVSLFMANIEFSQMDYKDFQNGPKKSTLLNDEKKKIFLKKIKKIN